MARELEPVESGEGPPANARETTLAKRSADSERALAEKVLEVDFSQVPCNKSRRDVCGAGKAGAQASTPRSGT